MFGNLEPVSEWRSVWSVRLRYARLADNGGYPYRDVIVQKPRELRRLIEWARRSPAIVAFPYTRIRQRYGNQPEECANGHAYVGGGSPFRVRVDWSECVCGGHISYLCFQCHDLRVDPAVWDDCSVTVETVAVTAARRLAPGAGGA